MMKRSHLIFALLILGDLVLYATNLQLIVLIITVMGAVYVVREKLKARKLDQQIKAAV